ncbi:MAG: putative LPS assembly protein LptD [Gemmatimonadota bacterium]
MRPDSAARDSARRGLEQRRQALSAQGYPTRDSVFQRLMGLPGYRAVEYRGQDVLLDLTEEEVRLRGDAQANYTSSVLEADSITYMIGLQFMRAGGNIRLLGEGNREVTSDSVLFYDISALKGTIMDARTVFAERGTQWIVRGTATPKGTETVYVQAGNFTTCDLEVPHYYFKAGKIKVVSENYIVAWPVVFYIHGIPVAWLPFIAQDIRPGRHSGFLPPRFGVNDIVDAGNTNRSVQDFGYYLALSPYLDTRFTVDWLSGRYTRLNGVLRYNFLKKFLRGNALTSYSFGDDGRSVELQGRHQQQLSPNTDFNLDLRYLNNTKLFEERTFDPRQQTQTINTNVGFNHRFDFASLQASARRQQFLGEQAGTTTLELPSLGMSFSPVTLFRAPRTRAGPFNNMTLSGAFNFKRQEQRFAVRDNTTTTTAGANQRLRIGRFNLTSSADFRDVRTIPFDSVAEPPAPFSRSTLNWRSSSNYQVDLMGSTTLRPSLQLDGALFKSPDTGGKYISTPTRMNLGATLSTDLYAFLPGFGPFSRIRHKVSPNFSYAYSPEATVPDSLRMIPGFPAGSSAERNMLSVTVRQTLEAKLRPEKAERLRRAAAERARDTAEVRAPAGGGEPAGRPPGEAEGAKPAEEPAPGQAEAAGREAAAVPEGEVAEGVARQEAAVAPGQRPAPPGAGAPGGAVQRAPGLPQAAGGLAGSRRLQQERKVTLLSINSSALVFDFTRENEPTLITDRWSHSFTSDLLRNFSFNMALDLFKGTGEERDFSPFLSEITGQFSLNSQTGLAGIFGLDQPGRSRQQPVFGRQRIGSRYRLSDFGRDPFLDGPLDAGTGPWNLAVTYSVSRTRAEEFGQERQSLGGRLRFRPTPNWRMQWSTNYDVKEGEFALNLITFERQLHRWQAFFNFSRSPNGNFQFQVMVNLTDAPEIRFDYDQQAQKGR